MSARWLAGGAGVLVLAVVLTLASLASVDMPAVKLGFGALLPLSFEVGPLTRVAALLVPAIAIPVVIWAAAHEDRRGIGRLVGLLVAFACAMEILVLAADLVTLFLGWEAVGAISYVLIAHRYDGDEAPSSASYAFNVTRAGGLGLLLAAGAALASTGSFEFASLGRAAASPRGDLLAAGLLVAAASKSAQVPFAPWLFRAMDGPTSASALLHSSTMVAAGAWSLLRLAEPLAIVPWAGPAAVGVGLVTACAGGLVAAAQPHGKRLLAASTSAQYGLVFAAAGASSVGAGAAHLVAHAPVKALLFLAAGTATAAAGSPMLRDMKLGRAMPAAAAVSAVGALALAGVPPLGIAWSKELVVAAVAHASTAGAVAAIGAGGLGALYATRFQLLAFGRGERSSEATARTRPSPAELAAMALLALCALSMSALFVPSVRDAAASFAGVSLPRAEPWELPVSIAVVLASAGAAVLAVRARTARLTSVRQFVAGWLGLPVAIDRLATRPTVALAVALARFDDEVVDAGLRGAAWLGTRAARGLRVLAEQPLDAAVHLVARGSLGVSRASRAADDRGVDAAVEGAARGVGHASRAVRGAQTGAAHFYYALAVAGALLLAVVLFLGRR